MRPYPVLKVPPLGRWAKLADKLMTPLMYLVSGTFSEAPQQTHRWNNHKLTHDDVAHLESVLMAKFSPDPGAGKRGIIRFHLPFLGGWKTYVVISPETSEEWHIGWIAQDTVGVSRISASGPVRVLLGSGPVQFFGVRKKDGWQIPLRYLGSGRIGNGGEWKNLPLL